VRNSTVGTATRAVVLTIRSAYMIISSRPATAIAASSRALGAARLPPGTVRTSCPAIAAAPLM